MIRTQYQLLKDNEPIAVGSMTHCLDVFYWEIYYGYDHLLYNIVPFKQDEEVYCKAKAFDEILKVENQATVEDKITGEYESNIEIVLSEYVERVDDEG